MVDGHEREGWIDLGIDDGYLQLIDRIDRLPVMNGSAAKRVDGDLERGAANGIHVDDIAQIVDVGQEEIFLVRRLRPDRNGESHSLHAGIVVAQKLIGPVFDPLG